jgi:hypothetical protein
MLHLDIYELGIFGDFSFARRLGASLPLNV